MNLPSLRGVPTPKASGGWHAGTVRTLAAVALAATAGLAHAGRPCENKPLELAHVERGMALAEATAMRLDTSGAQVVVLARAGQDLSKYGLRWSHLGFAYREEAAAPRDASSDGAATAQGAAPRIGTWRVVHKLNHCGTANAEVYRQGLGEFFLDRPHRYEAAFVVLRPEVQARLLPLLRSNSQLEQWHERRYNMVAYPWSQAYQQSNQWAIETLAGAIEPGATTRAQAQAWLQFKGYQPSTLRIDALTRLGARVTAANIAFDDHPNEKRFSDRIDTVTVDSVFAWLARSGLGERPLPVP